MNDDMTALKKRKLEQVNASEVENHTKETSSIMSLDSDLPYNIDKFIELEETRTTDDSRAFTKVYACNSSSAPGFTLSGGGTIPAFCTGEPNKMNQKITFGFNLSQQNKSQLDNLHKELFDFLGSTAKGKKALAGASDFRIFYNEQKNDSYEPFLSANVTDETNFFFEDGTTADISVARKFMWESFTFNMTTLWSDGQGRAGITLQLKDVRLGETRQRKCIFVPVRSFDLQRDAIVTEMKRRSPNSRAPGSAADLYSSVEREKDVGLTFTSGIGFPPFNFIDFNDQDLIGRYCP